MEQRAIKALLEQVAAGQMDVDDALLQLKLEPFQELGYAKLDSHRGLRQGVAEVIYGAGKTPEQIAGIVDAMRAGGQETILITRMSAEAAAAKMNAHFPDQEARCFFISPAIAFLSHFQGARAPSPSLKERAAASRTVQPPVETV